MGAREDTDLRWRKSSHSGGNGGCVEAAPTPAFVAVRDSKNRDGGQLKFTPTTWRALLDTLS
jgi:hypothetical protein